MSYQEELLIRIRSAYEGGGFSSLSADMSKAKAGYNQVANSAGTTGSAIGRDITKGTTVASSGMSKLQTSSVSTFGAIKAGASAAKNSLGDMGTLITGLVGGIGVMEVAQSMWTGSTTKQFNAAYLQTKMSSAAATEYISQIQKIVAEVPGDDTFMNNLMTGAVAKQTNLTATELKALGIASADYLTTSQAMGKTQLETQMDLKEYILTGNTSQLERDSILKQQMSTLEGQGTVSERILALNKALQAEGYAGLSQLDIASIKMEEFKGKLQLSATTIGEKILPYIEKVLDFILELDEKTNGMSSVWLVIGGTIALLVIALSPLVGATSSAYLAMKKYREEAQLAAIANASNKGPSTSGTTGTTGTSTSRTMTTGERITLAAGGLIIGVALASVVAEETQLETKKMETSTPKNANMSGLRDAFSEYSTLFAGFGGAQLGSVVSWNFLNSISETDLWGQVKKALSITPGVGGLFGFADAITKKSQLAYLAITGWWGGLPAWFGGLGNRIGQVWGDVINYFNDKTTIGGQVYDALKKIYCIIMGCSPGIIPALQMLYLYAVFVFNAILGPVITVKSTIEGFVLYIMLRMALLQNDIITKWNMVRAIVGIWIGTGIAVVTDGINWAIIMWNQATGTISVWVGTGVSVATNAIDTAWAYWQRLKDFVKDPIQGVINIVTQNASAGSPYEVDYLYGKGSYYEPDYIPISTTSAVTSMATATSSTSTSKIVISEGAVKIEVGTIDSKERVKEVENAVTVALSDINDSKGR